MRKLLIAIAAVSLISTAAVAEDKVSIDMEKVCQPGCTIVLNFSEQARYDARVKSYHDEFKPMATANPMAFFHGMVVTTSGAIFYEIISEPGSPMFRDLKDIQEYMKGQNELIRKAKNTPSS